MAARAAAGRMSIAETLRRLVGALESAGVPYMLTGSLASTWYGEPRSTQDVDIVVVLTLASLRALIGALPEDRYYVSEGAAKDALRFQGQFNVIDLESGWKIDFIIRKRRAFSEIEFERRVQRELMGVTLSMCTAEDSILSKLEWAQKSGGSERQLRDVGDVLEMRRDELDLDYIARWAAELGVGELWERVQRENV